jgi:hypothetical protein
MYSFETVKERLAGMNGQEFPLLFWHGTGRIVSVGQATVALQVRGKRAEYTWERLQNVWERIAANHSVSVDELGGLHDAVGAVSVLAALNDPDLLRDDKHGVLQWRDPQTKAVHENVPMVEEGTWAVMARKIGGN